MLGRSLECFRNNQPWIQSNSSTMDNRVGSVAFFTKAFFYENVLFSRSVFKNASEIKRFCKKRYWNKTLLKQKRFWFFSKCVFTCIVLSILNCQKRFKEATQIVSFLWETRLLPWWTDLAETFREYMYVVCTN